MALTERDEDLDEAYRQRLVSLVNQLQRFEDKSYATYQSKLAASQRLAWRGAAWNGTLIATAFTTSIASLALLVEPQAYGARGGALLVAIALLSLTTSLAVSGLQYGLRQRAMEADYKAVQALSVRIESKRRSIEAPNRPSPEEVKGARQLLDVSSLDYERIILNGENHATVDYIRGVEEQEKYAGFKRWRIRALAVGTSAAPILVAGLALYLLVPLISWWP